VQISRSTKIASSAGARRVFLRQQATRPKCSARCPDQEYARPSASAADVKQSATDDHKDCSATRTLNHHYIRQGVGTLRDSHAIACAGPAAADMSDSRFLNIRKEEACRCSVDGVSPREFRRETGLHTHGRSIESKGEFAGRLSMKVTVLHRVIRKFRREAEDAGESSKFR